MFNKIFKKTKHFGTGLLVTLIFISTAIAGGFILSVEIPNSTTNAELKDVFLLVRPLGCHQPSDAKLEARAEGTLEGKRISLPIRLTKMNESVYTIRKQWPDNGAWILVITGRYRGLISSAFVELNATDNLKAKTMTAKAKNARLGVKVVSRKASQREIESMLRKHKIALNTK